MENTIQITRARHAWPEKAGFIIDRPKGLPEYTFLHFHNSVEILVDGEVVVTPPGAVIFFAADTPQWFRSPDPLLHDWMHMTGDMEAMLRDVGLAPDRLYFPGNSRFITPILRQISPFGTGGAEIAGAFDPAAPQLHGAGGGGTAGQRRGKAAAAGAKHCVFSNGTAVDGCGYGFPCLCQPLEISRTVPRGVWHLAHG